MIELYTLQNLVFRKWDKLITFLSALAFFY